MDYNLFKKHKENIEIIISNWLSKIGNLNVSEGKIYLYSADSTKIPEKQEVII